MLGRGVLIIGCDESNSMSQDSNLSVNQSAEEDVYDDGCLRVEHDNFYVVCRGTPVTLTRAEFLYLSLLVRKPGRVVKSEYMWRRVWGDSKPYNADSLHVFMYRLRNKMAPFGIRVENMVHAGYRLSLQECCAGGENKKVA